MSADPSSEASRPGSTGPGSFATSVLPYLLLACIVARFLFESAERPGQIDDAYISYRYARNLASGLGLVFNPGEFVEGITNLFWTLLIALGLLFGLEAPAVAHGLGLASGVAVLCLSYAYAWALLPPHYRFGAPLAPAIVASSAGFSIWSISGLETPLFSALATGALLAAARGRMGWATGCAFLATVTRPEGLLLAGVLLGSELLPGRAAGSRKWRWPLLYGLAILLLTGFRLWYYGSPVPNTFYAKVGDIPLRRGFLYLLDFLRNGSLLLVPALVAAAPGDRRRQLALGWIALHSVFVVWVGGDVFTHSRFFMPMLPCMAALSVVGAAAVHERSRAGGWILATLIVSCVVWAELGPATMLLVASGVAAALTLVAGGQQRWRRSAGAGAAALATFSLSLGLYGAPGPVASQRDFAVRQTRGGFRYLEVQGRSQVDALAGLEPAPVLVAGVSIGVLGYYSEFRILDLLGLTDPVIARNAGDSTEGAHTAPGHTRSNAEYVLAREPDAIVMPQVWRVVLPANRALVRHPGFRDHYTWDPGVQAYVRDSAE